jgi:hypothetical protein
MNGLRGRLWRSDALRDLWRECRSIYLLLIVHPDGEIYPLRRDLAGDDQIQSASSSKMSVLTADKDQYETLILDLMGVE